MDRYRIKKGHYGTGRAAVGIGSVRIDDSLTDDVVESLIAAGVSDCFEAVDAEVNIDSGRDDNEETPDDGEKVGIKKSKKISDGWRQNK